MNVMPMANPYAPELPPYSAAHMQNVARRRWMAQQDRERKLKREQDAVNPVDRVSRIRRLRPGRAAASQLSPVYNMFNESLFGLR